ncbi:LAME_0G17898g1_1 [Lachancea meyersii CBS 8951]|uniref:LAME_0G17898g1_1 n=1 Tax=Lachancea meyersii CBS 8951 TaxID=1266667 RepID=A0A1G4KBM8_9SACH|nr:LAME_0G17898g1_1 [Lachancea meyersii CBS 8951]
MSRFFAPLKLKRHFHHLKISDEVRSALLGKQPVVALESTIITHGLPFPQNLEMATLVESQIRNEGAIPATIAFIDGLPTVGLHFSEIERLATTATTKAINKVSRRDVAYTMANKLLGGTTISSTMLLSHMAGIDVFATGGLGGVHRGAETTMDISADLDELGRTPVAVVCAGPKAILDIEKTMEYLETKGCMVATLGSPGTNVPGFYFRDSGVPSPYNFENFSQAAQIINAGHQLGLQSGYLMCVPPPEGIALDESWVKGIIDSATIKANKLGIRGKKLTPFLLGEISRETQGVSVKSNVDFVLNNARAGAQIAIEVSKLSRRNDAVPHIQPSQIFEPIRSAGNVSVVVGAVALDTQSTVAEDLRMKDSNPGKVYSSVGGVGYNVALAAHLSNRYSEVSTKLISSVGDDISGSAILAKLGLPIDSIFVDPHHATAQYSSMHSSDGELVVACADMDITTKLPNKFLSNQLEVAKPKIVVADANIAVQTLQELQNLQSKLNYMLVFEPTSDTKAKKLSLLKGLKVYPQNEVFLITPTTTELKSIYESFEKADKFDVDNWFPVLDSLQIDNALKVEQQTESFSKSLSDVRRSGVFHMACNLLPYFPRILVKDGANGIYVFTLKEDVAEEHAQESLAKYAFMTKGLNFGGKRIGMMFEHYEVPELSSNVKSVTGAGDTLLGVLCNELCHKGDVFGLSASTRLASFERAQLGAKMTVEEVGSVSRRLKQLA